MRRRSHAGAVILLGACLLLLRTTSAAERHKLPLIMESADPCTEACTFNLCVVDGELQRCAQQCGLVDARVELPADRPVIVKLPQYLKVLRYPQPRRSPRVALLCQGVGRPCWPCKTDADCDDRDPATLDLCFSPRCAHVCQ